MTQQKNKLLFVEPLRIHASLWLRLLEAEAVFSELEAVAELSSAFQRAAEYDMIVLGASLDPVDALAFAQRVSTSLPHTRVVIAGVPRSEPAVLRAIESGAMGLILREEGVEEALQTILAVAQGQSRIAPELAQEVMQHLVRLRQSNLDPDTRGQRYSNLSEREREVLELVARGLSNPQIADALFIEIGTVKNHVHNMLQKLEVSNRHKAARYLRSLDPAIVEDLAATA